MHDTFIEFIKNGISGLKKIAATLYGCITLLPSLFPLKGRFRFENRRGRTKLWLKTFAISFDIKELRLNPS